MAACVPKGGKGEVLAPRGQLIERAEEFNRFLRWKAYDRAKYFVAPKKRPAFVLEWERNRPHVRITDFRVRDITETKTGKEAIVLVVIHRHRLPSVSLKRVLEQQRWESTNGYWFFVEVKDVTDVEEKPKANKKSKKTKKPSSSQPAPSSSPSSKASSAPANR